MLYHGSCPDGFGGAYAAWKKFGDTAEYIPLYRGEELPSGIDGAHLYLIDFSYEKELMDELAAKAASMVVLDHHEGVREVVESMPEHVFDNNRSGATIAWDYFHPGTPRPRLLTHIEDDDLFRFTLPDTRALLSYISVKPYTFEFWDALAQELEDDTTRTALLSKLTVYGEYFTLLAELAVDKAHLVSFEGYEVYFASAHPFKPMKSLVGNLLAKKQGPFALVASAHPKGFGISIRGDGSVDVSKIAQKYGGNGHVSSSGFLIPAGGPIPWTIIDNEDTSN